MCRHTGRTSSIRARGGMLCEHDTHRDSSSRRMAHKRLHLHVVAAVAVVLRDFYKRVQPLAGKRDAVNDPSAKLPFMIDALQAEERAPLTFGIQHLPHSHERAVVLSGCAGHVGLVVHCPAFATAARLHSHRTTTRRWLDAMPFAAAGAEAGRTARGIFQAGILPAVRRSRAGFCAPCGGSDCSASAPQMINNE
eukprot:6563623-Prymnesium_polylepis.1